MQLCRSCALKSDAKNRAEAGGKRGSRSRPFHFRLACLIFATSLRHRLLRPSLLSLSCICHDLLSLWAHYPNLANKLAPQMPKRHYKNTRQIPKRKCCRISKAELLIKCLRAENKITSGTVVKVSL